MQSINLIREESSDLAKRGILAAGQLYGISNQRLIRAERIIQEGTTIPISLVLHRIFKSLLTAIQKMNSLRIHRDQKSTFIANGFVD